MVAAGNEYGEGEMLPGQLRQVLGNNFTFKCLKEICTGLEEKGLVVIKPSQWYCTKRCSLVVAYRIILPGYSGLNDGETNIVLKSDKAKSG
jgi:hypothetical protein